MSVQYRFVYEFYAVGQGLFSSGAIRREAETTRFLWVYDCGTSSKEELVDRGIGELKVLAGTRKRIDLLVLSHFDHDHISGVTRLLREFEIGTLMLPYMSLAQRLVLAFEEDSGDVNDPLVEFYLNPAEFLQLQSTLGIDRILFVLPSGNEGPAYPGETPDSKGPGSDSEIQLEYLPYKPNESDDIELLQQAAPQNVRTAQIHFLAPGSRLTLSQRLWEFIPYNDDQQEAITVDFRNDVEAVKSALLSAKTKSDRDESLKRLKKAYDVHFGAGSEERNVISLFLYSGPIYRSWRKCALVDGTPWLAKQTSRLHVMLLRGMLSRIFGDPSVDSSRARCSILYSGDGYLDTNDRLQRLIKYLNSARVKRVGVFQVMHHGAEANWHQGVAAAIAPLFSIFSSDPNRRKWKHPHALVLRDFWPHGPIQVDKDAEFSAFGYLED